MANAGMDGLRILIVGEAALDSGENLSSIFQECSPLPMALSHFHNALATIRSEIFDSIIVDCDFDGGDGIVLAPIIKRISPRCQTILLTSNLPWARVEAAKYLGFDEVLSKGSTKEEIQSALTPIARVDRSSHQLRASSKIHLLSPREREVLIAAATGATTDEIARKNHNSIATVKSQFTSIYRKLEVRNRIEAIAQLEY
jgi:two-component system response regulator DesR